MDLSFSYFTTFEMRSMRSLVSSGIDDSECDSMFAAFFEKA